MAGATVVDGLEGGEESTVDDVTATCADAACAERSLTSPPSALAHHVADSSAATTATSATSRFVKTRRATTAGKPRLELDASVARPGRRTPRAVDLLWSPRRRVTAPVPTPPRAERLALEAHLHPPRQSVFVANSIVEKRLDATALNSCLIEQRTMSM